MPRPIKQKCLECASLKMEDVHALHGAEGDGCWNPQVCRTRRSLYRHRDKLNFKRREKYFENTWTSSESVESSVEFPFDKIEILLNQRLLLQVIIYLKEGTEDEPHSIEARVWEGESPLAKVAPQHCLGMTSEELDQYISNVKHWLETEHGIEIATRVEFLRVEQRNCPLCPCLLFPQEVQQLHEKVKQIDVSINHHPLLQVVIYKEGEDIHSIEARVWREEKLIASCPPQHCFGMTDDELNHYIANIKRKLRVEHGIKITTQAEFFTSRKENCPVVPCPLPHAEVKQVSIWINQRPLLQVIIYKEGEEPHLIEARVWKGHEFIAWCEPRHCIGLTDEQLDQYISCIKHRLSTEYGVEITTRTEFFIDKKENCLIPYRSRS
jgi:hypothetical protein